MEVEIGQIWLRITMIGVEMMWWPTRVNSRLFNLKTSLSLSLSNILKYQNHQKFSQDKTKLPKPSPVKECQLCFESKIKKYILKLSAYTGKNNSRESYR